MAKIQAGFFDEQFKLERISKLGDPLEKLNATINWELFRYTLDKHLEKEAKGPGGRPNYDYILMFKILILQEYFGLSDEQMEFQITDRFSFMRFLGLHSYNKVPDSNTIWTFRERLKDGDVVKELFDRFGKELNKQGLIVNKGKIIDATIIEVPIQRNSRDDNKEIKEGNIPDEWSDKQQAHKDTDARWTRKNNEDYFGYKNHIKVDSKKKFIDNYCVTEASVHDSLGAVDLLDKKDKGQPLHADSAYTGEAFENAVDKVKMINKIHEKGYRNHPLSEQQIKSNNIKSKIRVRVEHVFGFMHQTTGGLLIRTIGKRRAEIKIGLMNITYNLFRYSWYNKLSWAKCGR
jgi:IS5 family transposase